MPSTSSGMSGFICFGDGMSALRTRSSVEKSLSPKKKTLPGQALMEHGADREDVASPVERQPPHLLR